MSEKAEISMQQLLKEHVCAKEFLEKSLVEISKEKCSIQKRLEIATSENLKLAEQCKELQMKKKMLMHKLEARGQKYNKLMAELLKQKERNMEWIQLLDTEKDTAKTARYRYFEECAQLIRQRRRISPTSSVENKEIDIGSQINQLKELDSTNHVAPVEGIPEAQSVTV